MSKAKIGILYDFDKTLCTTDMQEYSFIKNLDMNPSDFWGEAARAAGIVRMWLLPTAIRL